MMKPLAMLLAVLVAAPILLVPAPAPAADDVKIALVTPLSGRWARQGQLKKMGAEMAIAEINAQGGIKALGSAAPSWSCARPTRATASRKPSAPPSAR
jgi:branched-chain amino acid transport system substrate-binding protein